MNNLKLGIVFDVKNGKFKSDVKQSGQVVKQFGQNTSRTAAQARQLGTALDHTNAKFIATNKLAQSVTRSIGGLAAGFGAIQLGQGLVKELAAFQDIRTRLQGLSASSADYAAKERWLIDLATEHHKELNGLADGYSRLSTLTQEKIINDGQARDMLEGLSNAASRNGAGTADLERVYYGLSQALGAGTVNMEDFRQVTDPLPDLMAKIARAAGQETSAGLKELIASGTYTSEVFGKHLVKALQDYAGASAETADNINAKYIDIKNEYLLLAKELERPISGVLLPTLDGLAEGLSFLKDHTEGVITVLQGGLVLAAGHATNAILTKTAAVGKSVIAHRAKTQAVLATAKADEVLAVSANHRAIQEQAAAKRSLANATNTYARTRAVKNLAIANGQLLTTERALIVTTGALTAATTRAKLATQAMAVSARVASGAMALLGGPVGVAMLASYAIYEFAMSAADGARESTNLAAGVDLASKKLSELSAKQLKLRLFELEDDPQTQIDAARLGALKAQQEYNKVQAARGFKNPNKEGAKVDLSRDVEIEALEAKAQRIDKLKAQIKVLLAKPDLPESKPVVPPKNQVTPVTDNTATELARIEQSLLSKEDAINASYLRRQQIVDTALLGKKDQEQKYHNLSIGLEIEKDLALKGLSDQKLAKEKALSEKKIAQEKRHADAKVQAALNARERADQIRRDGYAAELAELNGFHLMKMELKAGQTEEELEHARNRNLMLQQEERDHQDAKRNLQLRNTGEYGNTVKQFVQFERESGADRLAVGLQIATGLTAINASESKKQFEMHKKMSIASATVAAFLAITTTMGDGTLGTYEKIAASIAIGAMAFSNVQKIRSQKFQGQAHDGISQVPKANEGTWMLKQDEMVLNPQQRENFEFLVDYAKNQPRYQQQRQGLSNGGLVENQEKSVTVQLNVTATDTGGFDQWYRSNRNMIIADVSDAVRTPA